MIALVGGLTLSVLGMILAAVVALHGWPSAAITAATLSVALNGLSEWARRRDR